jgi:transcriptional regulator with XRE-family HTH domain|tara:strand:- start:156 stop:623 length:468 start_codon:yes stop_codon:yes gene_type:complete
VNSDLVNPVSGGEENLEEAKAKDLRAQRFLQVLERHMIPIHGAQTKLAKRLGVSEATIAAWMRGSLPRDPVNLIKFCDEYDVDLYWWVNGEARPRMSLDYEKLVRAGKTVDAYIQEHGLSINGEQRSLLMGDVYSNPKDAEQILTSASRWFKQSD